MTGAQGFAVAVLVISGMLASMQFTLVVPSLPAFATALEVSSSAAAWLVTMTLLAGAVGTPALTRMADMYGRRRMLLVSLSLLILGSLLAAVGMSFPLVLCGRALQGFASAIVPMGISLMRDLLPSERAGTAAATMSATVGLGSASGLLLSGLLSENFGITAIFWFSAGAGVLAIGGLLFTVREPTTYTGGKFDLVGALLLSVILAGTLFVISESGRWSELDVYLVLVAGAGLVATIFWIPHQLRTPSAVIDLRTAFRRPILQTNVATFFATAGMFGNHLLTAHEVQAPAGIGAGLAMGPVDAGLAMIPASIALAALSPVAGLLLNRIDGRMVLALGSLIMSLAFVYRIFTHGSLLTIVTGATLVGIGTALSFAAMPALIMSYVRQEDAAAANGINSLIRTFSGAATSAVFALLVSRFAVTFGGAQFLTETGLSIAFSVVAASCGLGALLAILLPSGSKPLVDLAPAKVAPLAESHAQK